jgi:hypothetical protein
MEQYTELANCNAGCSHYTAATCTICSCCCCHGTSSSCSTAAGHEASLALAGGRISCHQLSNSKNLFVCSRYRLPAPSEPSHKAPRVCLLCNAMPCWHIQPDAHKPLASQPSSHLHTSAGQLWETLLGVQGPSTSWLGQPLPRKHQHVPHRAIKPWAS